MYLYLLDLSKTIPFPRRPANLLSWNSIPYAIESTRLLYTQIYYNFIILPRHTRFFGPLSHNFLLTFLETHPCSVDLDFSYTFQFLYIILISYLLSSTVLSFDWTSSGENNYRRFSNREPEQIRLFYPNHTNNNVRFVCREHQHIV